MSDTVKEGRAGKSPATRRRRDARENQERIVRSAGRVFAEHGLAATLADVAREAGVGVGTVYRCFANKDDLILALFAKRFSEIEQQVLKATQADDPWDGLVLYFEDAARETATDRGFREFVMGSYTASLGWARSSTPDRIIALVRRTDMAMRGHVTALVRRAKATGMLRKDLHPTDLLALTIALQSTVEFGGRHRPDLYRRMIGLVLDGLRTSRSRPTPLPAPALTDEQVALIRTRRPPDE